MENVINLAHSGEIRGLSTAVWRPYAISAGQDRNLFLWNVATEEIQFRKLLDEDILSATLHPMGHYVAITTPDSLQIFSVLVDRFHLVREVILAGCRKLAFNSGGNWIAVTRGSSLQLINFITFETSSPMIAHKADVIITGRHYHQIVQLIKKMNLFYIRLLPLHGVKTVRRFTRAVWTDSFANGIR